MDSKEARFRRAVYNAVKARGFRREPREVKIETSGFWERKTVATIYMPDGSSYGAELVQDCGNEMIIRFGCLQLTVTVD